MIEQHSYSLKGKSDQTWFQRKKDLNFWAHLSPAELGIDLFENVPSKLISENTIKTECCDQMKDQEGQIEIKYDIKTESLALPTDTEFKCLICNECNFVIEENYANCDSVYCHANVEDNKFAIPSIYSDTIKELRIILTDINTLKLYNIDEASELKVEHNEVNDSKHFEDPIFKPENISIEKEDCHKSGRRFPVKEYEVTTRPAGVLLHRIEDTISFLNNLELRPVCKNKKLFKSPTRLKRLGKFRRNLSKKT